MFGLEKIVFNNEALNLSPANDAGNFIYSPYIKGFSTKIDSFHHQATPTFFNTYLKIDLEEYNDSGLKLRAVFVQGQIRSLNPSSRLLPTQFTHAVVFKQDNDGLLIDFYKEFTNRLDNNAITFTQPPNLFPSNSSLWNVAPAIVDFNVNYSLEESVVESSNILTFKLHTNKEDDSAHTVTLYTSGIYYVI